MNKEEFKALMHKISDGLASDQEIAIYNRYFNAYQKAGLQWDESEMGSQQLVYAKLKQSIKAQIRPVSVIPLWKKPFRIVAAAVILIISSVSVILYLNHQSNDVESFTKNDVGPGKNKAILTLANGEKINLSDAADGTLLKNVGLTIVKTADGKLIYKVSDVSGINSKTPTINTITTPRGGQFQVNLPDGSAVWLNAESSISFPTAFTKAKREVTLSGEAYFEVFHNPKQPFIVKTATQRVEVLGTHFNINSYADEPAVKTTLLQGSVKVTQEMEQGAGSRDEGAKNKDKGAIDGKQGGTVILAPGEQAILNSNGLNTLKADIEATMDWKNGEFIFKNENIYTIMRKISRWYDVTVVFEDNELGKGTFSGSVSRYDNVSEILKALQLTETIHFKLENKKITVLR